jgi:hypothetical protein
MRRRLSGIERAARDGDGGTASPLLAGALCVVVMAVAALLAWLL